ncbi:hypothetical protein DPMN_016065 [Dreissena polymorpha]|uniref:Uncharacterized protein n=1 Tax=Dreissena polymorpha TaxID=45954 RepID=A0A9D4NCM9_DREPO|nr:hypothetical protein DPMN_016065 [Dreissena polymorpha]
MTTSLHAVALLLVVVAAPVTFGMFVSMAENKLTLPNDSPKPIDKPVTETEERITDVEKDKRVFNTGFGEPDESATAIDNASKTNEASKTTAKTPTAEISETFSGYNNATMTAMSMKLKAYIKQIPIPVADSWRDVYLAYLRFLSEKIRQYGDIKQYNEGHNGHSQHYLSMIQDRIDKLTDAPKDASDRDDRNNNDTDLADGEKIGKVKRTNTQDDEKTHERDKTLFNKDVDKHLGSAMNPKETQSQKVEAPSNASEEQITDDDMNQQDAFADVDVTDQADSTVESTTNTYGVRKKRQANDTIVNENTDNANIDALNPTTLIPTETQASVTQEVTVLDDYLFSVNSFLGRWLGGTGEDVALPRIPRDCLYTKDDDLMECDPQTQTIVLRMRRQRFPESTCPPRIIVPCVEYTRGPPPGRQDFSDRPPETSDAPLPVDTGPGPPQGRTGFPGRPSVNLNIPFMDIIPDGCRYTPDRGSTCDPETNSIILRLRGARSPRDNCPSNLIRTRCLTSITEDHVPENVPFTPNRDEIPFYEQVPPDCIYEQRRACDSGTLITTLSLRRPRRRQARCDPVIHAPCATQLQRRRRQADDKSVDIPTRTDEATDEADSSGSSVRVFQTPPRGCFYLPSGPCDYSLLSRPMTRMFGSQDCPRKIQLRCTVTGVLSMRTLSHPFPEKMAASEALTGSNVIPVISAIPTGCNYVTEDESVCKTEAGTGFVRMRNLFFSSRRCPPRVRVPCASIKPAKRHLSGLAPEVVRQAVATSL